VKTVRFRLSKSLRNLTLFDQALAEASKARSAVANTKMDLQNQLTATGDPSAAASNALAAAKVNQEASTFQPLGIMFQNTTAGLSNLGGGPAYGYGGIIGSPYGGSNGILPASGYAGASRTVG
jgi:hypothetical protein